MLKLFDYQVAVLDKLRAEFAAGKRQVILVAPTGAGKTEMAISLMDAASKKYNHSAMIMDRVVLCTQTSERLEKYKLSHGVLQSGHPRYAPSERIQICSAQTIEKRGFPNVKMMIVDEAHQTRESVKDFIKAHPDIMVVGLTATPFTKGLAHTYQSVVSSVTTEELVNQKRLVPLRVYISKEIDMTGAKKGPDGDWAASECEERGMKITGDIVAEWVSKTHATFGGPRKTVVFCAGVNHGAELARKFADAGYNFVALSYKDDSAFKDDAIAEFAKPDSSIHGLIATDILTKGFDVPDVMIGVSARPFSKSLSSHIQQMGRVMRSHPSKEFALWLDHGGNYLRFREDWEDVYHNGVTKLDDGREKTKKEPTEKEKTEAKCPKCNHLWAGATDTCACCGYVRPARNKIIEHAGEMELLHEAADRATKQLWYSCLLHRANEKKYSDGWVAHQYRTKFGVWPRGLEPIPTEPTKEVKSWLVSRQIAFAKSKFKGAANAVR